jgi:hypothetical protein
MGKQPGRHTDWVCNDADCVVRQERRMGPANIGGDGRRCQRRDTLSPGSRKPSSEKISQVIYLLTLAEQLAAQVMEMKLHRLRDVRSDYGLLKQYG